MFMDQCKDLQQCCTGQILHCSDHLVHFHCWHLQLWPLPRSDLISEGTSVGQKVWRGQEAPAAVTSGALNPELSPLPVDDDVGVSPIHLLIRAWAPSRLLLVVKLDKWIADLKKSKQYVYLEWRHITTFYITPKNERRRVGSCSDCHQAVGHVPVPQKGRLAGVRAAEVLLARPGLVWSAWRGLPGMSWSGVACLGCPGLAWPAWRGLPGVSWSGVACLGCPGLAWPAWRGLPGMSWSGVSWSGVACLAWPAWDVLVWRGLPGVACLAWPGLAWPAWRGLPGMSWSGVACLAWPAWDVLVWRGLPVVMHGGEQALGALGALAVGKMGRQELLPPAVISSIVLAFWKHVSC
ncbi:uncharacterized protein LOC126076125 [Elephas maximus indicus]|uniref:uncharacterized protein LOC126076125 n=1 Tax=Elephas maximus indicus TaxID=99487 RepID=UPI002115F38B|nr:uncharacterized protein LOC126076125 [Elephas maximus indicus]